MARASVMTQKEELAAAQARITELETAAASHAATLIEGDARISDLESSLQVSVLAAETFEAQVTELTATGETHVTTIAAHVATIAAKDAEIKTLKDSAKTLDAAAEEKAREIAARSGTNLPPKKPGAGDNTTDPKGTGTPRERLAAHFDSQLRK